MTTMPVTTCALCANHSDNTYHSTYHGHPIIKCTSWITTTTHWHTDFAHPTDTLRELKRAIRTNEEF